MYDCIYTYVSLSLSVPPSLPPSSWKEGSGESFSYTSYPTIDHVSGLSCSVTILQHAPPQTNMECQTGREKGFCSSEAGLSGVSCLLGEGLVDKGHKDLFRGLGFRLQAQKTISSAVFSIKVWVSGPVGLKSTH